LPDRILSFDLKREKDAALFFLLLRLKWFIQKTRSCPDIKACVFIDEGFQKSGTTLTIPTFDDVFSDSLVCFSDSSSVLPIQLADFAAFMLNRVQLVAGRQTRNHHDQRLLEISSLIAENYVNIAKKSFSYDHDGPIITLADTRPNRPFE
jgi:hypothetical protein